MRHSAAVQRQNDVSVYFTSKQILPFAFAELSGSQLDGSWLICQIMIKYVSPTVQLHFPTIDHEYLHISHKNW